MTYLISEDAVPYTPKGIYALLELDKSFIGTPDYMGIAYFWNYEYRHYLRDATRYRRRLVHKKLVEAGLDLVGYTPAHTAIVVRFAGRGA
jgi:hypothetical protein